MNARPHQEQFEKFTALVTAELGEVSIADQLAVFPAVTTEELPVLIGVAVVWTAQAVRAAAGVADLDPSELWALMVQQDRERRREASNGTA